MLIAFLILLCPFTKETILVLLLKWTGEMHISADASALCLLKSRGVVTVSVRASLCSLIWCKGQSNLLMRALSFPKFSSSILIFFSSIFFFFHICNQSAFPSPLVFLLLGRFFSSLFVQLTIFPLFIIPKSSTVYILLMGCYSLRSPLFTMKNKGHCSWMFSWPWWCVI